RGDPRSGRAGRRVARRARVCVRAAAPRRRLRARGSGHGRAPRRRPGRARGDALRGRAAPASRDPRRARRDRRELRPMIRALSTIERDATVASYREHGFAVLRGVADEATLAPLRDRLDDLIAGRLPDPGLFFQRDATTGHYADVTFGSGWEGPDVPYRKIERLERDPLFRAWIENPVFRSITAPILGVPC